MNILRSGIITGLALTLIALIGYLGSGRESWTALIPSFIGIPILISSLVARKTSLMKHTMHLAAVFGLLGLLAALGKLASSLAQGSLEFNLATIMLISMSALCGNFLFCCIKSFREARQARQNP